MCVYIYIHIYIYIYIYIHIYIILVVQGAAEIPPLLILNCHHCGARELRQVIMLTPLAYILSFVFS